MVHRLNIHWRDRRSWVRSPCAGTGVRPDEELQARKNGCLMLPGFHLWSRLGRFMILLRFSIHLKHLSAWLRDLIHTFIEMQENKLQSLSRILKNNEKTKANLWVLLFWKQNQNSYRRRPTCKGNNFIHTLLLTIRTSVSFEFVLDLLKLKNFAEKTSGLFVLLLQRQFIIEITTKNQLTCMM